MSGLALLIFSSLFFAKLCLGAETSFDLLPQGEYIQSRTETVAARGILDAKMRVKSEKLFFNLNFFGILDGAPDNPSVRGDRNVFALQEAFIDFKIYKSWSMRLGRTPVRWSESWTLPSLDFWTGRRWNELFFLPVSYQLVHPTGALLTFDNGKTTLVGFANIYPAQDIYPPNFPVPPQPSNGQEYGLKGKLRAGGFDMAVVGAKQRQQNVLGANVSYAFDSFVPKVEGGVNNKHDRFGTLGIDFFFGDWSILPQATVYTTDLLPQEYQRIVFLPVRYATEQNTVELQLYGNLDSYDQFYSLLYTHDFKMGLQLTGYVQNYLGESGSLFGFYQTLTSGGTVFGLRIGQQISL